ncbi:MAG: winged helix-turn-helix domain-containing protein [Candidatus Nanohaloarchaea archaeon]
MAKVKVPTEKAGQNRLTGLLFNHKRYDILAYLLENEDRQLTISDIVDGVEEDVSRQHVTNLVNDLRDLGLVEKEKKGNLYLIEVNTDSPYYEPLKDLLEIDAKPLRKAAEEVVEEVLDDTEYENSIVAAYLFGSVARGAPQIDSDIDILIIHKEDLSEKGQQVITDMFETHGSELKVSFSITWYNQEEWERDVKRESAFTERVQDEWIHLAGEQL